jgi:hypothetical protein
MAWHAQKSASGSKQWIKCPGSLALVNSLPDVMRRPAGEAAMLGTAAHGLGEHCLNKGFKEVPAKMIGKTIWLDADEDACFKKPKVVKFETTIDDKMVDGVNLYLDVCWGDMEEMGPGTDMLVEERFNMDWLRPGLGGTSDCTLFQFLGLLRIIDYKNGFIGVEADDNTQAMTYALGVAHLRDWMFEEVEVVIVQPNSRGPSVKRWRITPTELREFQERLATASDTVDQAFEEFNPDPSWANTYLNAGGDDDHDHCTFCDALATCPAALKAAEAVALSDFGLEPPEGNPLEVHDDVSLERLVKVIKWGKYLDRFVKAAETLGQRRLEQGLEVPGHKLVAGKANRQWVSTDKEVATLIADALLVDVKECYEAPKPPALKSPAQMEKLGEARSPTRKAAKSIVDDLSHKPEGKLTMAPESDPREAVTLSSAADDFAD